MNHKDFLKGFMTAALLLPEPLSRAAFSLDDSARLGCEAFRIRLGRPITAQVNGRERVLLHEGSPVKADREMLDALLARVTGSSVHSYNSQMIQGYITTEQGHRLGLCGEPVREGERIVALRSLSSVNLRIAKQAVGVGEGLCKSLYEGGFDSTLIVAPPGAGKTTLLRDMARWLSGRMSVAMADERHELAACRQGVPQFDVGQCDVLTGCPKAAGIEQLIRGMEPRVIALDEITCPQDVRAVAQAAYCGCGFLTTVHGGGPEDLARRPIYRALMTEGIFKNIIYIENIAGRRSYRLWREGAEQNGQADGAGDDRGIMLGHGYFYEQAAEGPSHGPQELYRGASDRQGRDCLSRPAAP